MAGLPAREVYRIAGSLQCRNGLLLRAAEKCKDSRIPDRPRLTPSIRAQPVYPTRIVAGEKGFGHWTSHIPLRPAAPFPTATTGRLACGRRHSMTIVFFAGRHCRRKAHSSLLRTLAPLVASTFSKNMSSTTFGTTASFRRESNCVDEELCLASLTTVMQSNRSEH